MSHSHFKSSDQGTSSGRRPLIGISGPDEGGRVLWQMAALAIWRAGGRPKHVTVKRFSTGRELDGLILGGGADLATETVGLAQTTQQLKAASRSPNTGFGKALGLGLFLARRIGALKISTGPDLARDELERELLSQALQRDIPVLGICRGAQLLNVHLGGTLVGDTKSFYGETPVPRSVFPVKEAIVERDTRLYAILNRTRCRVNALHHQAICRLGSHVRINARESNGIIQGIEVDDAAFTLGVQWHPELLPQVESQMRLFQQLVHSARHRGGVSAHTSIREKCPASGRHPQCDR